MRVQHGALRSGPLFLLLRGTRLELLIAHADALRVFLVDFPVELIHAAEGGVGAVEVAGAVQIEAGAMAWAAERGAFKVDRAAQVRADRREHFQVTVARPGLDDPDPAYDIAR